MPEHQTMNGKNRGMTIIWNGFADTLTHTAERFILAKMMMEMLLESVTRIEKIAGDHP